MDLSAAPYLALVVIILLVIGLAVALASTYAGMRVIDRRMRKCPNCGTLGGGRPIIEEIGNEITSHGETSGGATGGGTSRGFDSRSLEAVPTVKYRCEKCGHQWTKEIVRRELTSIDT